MATAFDLLTVEEAAEYLRLSPFTVRKLLREGHLHGMKVGKRQWRVSKHDLQNYLSSNSQPADTAKPKWLILAEEQGAEPVTDVSKLIGQGWPEDEPIEEFLEELNKWRSEPYTGHLPE